jgi:hypothetical protein
MNHTGLLDLHGEVSELYSFDDQPYKATAKVVCAECNNGWMSRSEEAAKSYLAGMVEGRGRELHEGGQKELANWALLKAIIFDYAAPEKARTTFPDLRSHLHGCGEPPENCMIWLAAYGGEMPGFSAMTALAVAIDDEPYKAERNVWVRTFSVGPVVLQVFSTSNPALSGFDPNWKGLKDPPQVIQIWPTGESVRWLPGQSLNDLGLNWFANHIVGTLLRSSENHLP